MNNRKTLIALILVAAVLLVAVLGALGYLWYQENHLFVEDAVYPLHAEELDLRGEDISITHYDTLHWQLPNCRITWDVPFQGGRVDSSSTTVAVTSLTEEELDILCRYFPNLTKLDATGCRDYALLEQFRQKMPDCTLTYQVDVGGSWVDRDAESLVLQPGEYDLDTLLSVLEYLPQVTQITFRNTDLTLETLDTLNETYEAIAFQATVSILGTEYDSQTTRLDLSTASGGDVAELAQQLALLPGLTDVELMDASGNSSFSMEDVKTLKSGTEGVKFHYVFDFFGQSINTADSEVIVKDVKIGDENLTTVREALALMEGCDRFVLDGCGISNEAMASLREEFRDITKVVWRVRVANGNILTDVDCLYLTWDLKDGNCQNLKYFEDCRYLDAGHNENAQWTDLSPLSGMTSLEVFIASGASIKDLSPLESCKKLRILEIAYCGLVTDISPLAGCESLEMLNISDTHVTDLSPLDDLNITVLCAVQDYRSNLLPQETVEHFKEKHPDAEVHCTVNPQPYGSNWRYQPDAPSNTEEYYRDWYKAMRIALDYDHYERNFNKGWYLTESGERDTERTA